MQVSDKHYIKRLKEFGLKLITKYKSGDRVVEMDSETTLSSGIQNGIRLEKNYMKGGQSVFKLVNFDPRIKYSFMNPGTASRCPNCGAEIDSQSGECPYCGSSYNMDYSTKDLGTKYHTDLVMNSTSYRTITLLVDIAISFIISFVYVKTTGRTFNIYDMAKVLGGTCALGLALYYVFFYLDSLFVLLPIKLYKERINKQQSEFWDSHQGDINKTTFFTNLNYELQKFYFERPENRNIIDFDLVDYTEISSSTNGDKKYVSISILVREVYLDGTKIKCRQQNRTLKLEHVNREYSLEIGAATLKCKNCGASIDPFARQCPHCGTTQNYLQEWYLVF